MAGFRARPKQRGASQALFAPKLSDLYRGPGISTCEESDSPPPSGGRLPPSYIPTLGALFPRSGPVQDPVLTSSLLCAPLLQADPSALDPRFTPLTLGPPLHVEGSALDPRLTLMEQMGCCFP